MIVYKWLGALKDLPKIITDLGGVITRGNSVKNLLLSELKGNLQQFENAKITGLSYNRLIDILSNERVLYAQEKGFIFSTVKIGSIKEKHAKTKRDKKYLGKDCAWLFNNISEKLDELKKLKMAHDNLEEINGLNIALKFSNLLNKMKLLARFIK